jgi:hypothetical protein
MKNNKKVNRVSLAYKNMPATGVSAYMGWNISCMDGNAAFPKPPVPIVPAVPPDPNAPVDMTTRKASLDAAIAAALDGGTVLTALRNEALQFAIDGLDANAFYVQTTARYDLTMFLTSGYQTVSTNHGQSPVGTPSIIGMDNDVPTQLAVHLTSISNAIGYEVQILIANVWTTVKFSSQARTIILIGLTTGQVYQVRARALGGSTGESPWSVPSSSIVD